MKKILSLAVMAVFIFGGIFVLASCSKSDNAINGVVTPFEGKWVMEGSSDTLTFTGNTYTLINSDGTEGYKAAFTYTATDITATISQKYENGKWSDVQPVTDTAAYKLDGNTLTFGDFTYVKQD
ncbi:MAG: hypothetical protein FWC57_00185 [Endomicrobia bacterium]|nr:hypothetical protein [Endomicrobiia bacterium]